MSFDDVLLEPFCQEVLFCSEVSFDDVLLEQRCRFVRSGGVALPGGVVLVSFCQKVLTGRCRLVMFCLSKGVVLPGGLVLLEQNCRFARR